MSAVLSQLRIDKAAPELISGLPIIPGPGAFWAIVTWLIIPGVLLIWMAYHRRREGLRSIRRKLRQLEIRLAAATPAQSTGPVGLPRPAPASRPSSLTTRILVPASAATSPTPVFCEALPGPSI